jgi:Zn-dependent protease with chaperone function
MPLPNLPTVSLTIANHIHPKERTYFNILTTVSIGLWLFLVLGVQTFLLTWLLAFSLLIWLMHGLLVGNIRSNALKLGPQQHGDVYGFVQTLAKQHFHIDQELDVFILESGGLLNGFFTKFMGRNFVVLYSDVVKLADEGSEEALGFIIAHELAHVKLNHLSFWKTVFLCGQFIPFLGSAYSRAKEYSCDKLAHALFPQGASHGLLALMAGPSNVKRSNLDAVNKQFYEERGFWSWLAEITSTHPHLMCRLQALASVR